MHIKTYSLVFEQARMTQNAGYVNVFEGLYMDLEENFPIKPKRDWCENVFSLWLHKSFEFWHVSGCKTPNFPWCSPKKNWLPSSQNSIRLRTAPTIGSCRKARTAQVSWMWNTLTIIDVKQRNGRRDTSLHLAIDSVNKITASTSYVNVYSKFNVYCIVIKFVRFWHLHPNGMVTPLFCRTDAGGAASSAAYQKAKLLAEEVRFASLCWMLQ